MGSYSSTEKPNELPYVQGMMLVSEDPTEWTALCSGNDARQWGPNWMNCLMFREWCSSVRTQPNELPYVQGMMLVSEDPKKTEWSALCSGNDARQWGPNWMKCLMFREWCSSVRTQRKPNELPYVQGMMLVSEDPTEWSALCSGNDARQWGPNRMNCPMFREWCSSMRTQRKPNELPYVQGMMLVSEDPTEWTALCSGNDARQWGPKENQMNCLMFREWCSSVRTQPNELPYVQGMMLVSEDPTEWTALCSGNDARQWGPKENRMNCLMFREWCSSVRTQLNELPYVQGMMLVSEDPKKTEWTALCSGNDARQWGPNWMNCLMFREWCSSVRTQPNEMPYVQGMMLVNEDPKKTEWTALCSGNDARQWGPNWMNCLMFREWCSSVRTQRKPNELPYVQGMMLVSEDPTEWTALCSGNDARQWGPEGNCPIVPDDARTCRCIIMSSTCHWNMLALCSHYTRTF